MTEFDSVYDFFRASAARHASLPFLCIPERLHGDWNIAAEVSYGEAWQEIDALRRVYAAKGYGQGDVVALAFESRPQHIFHYLALNALGACVVPLNSDLTPSELAYQLSHSEACAVVGLEALRPLVAAAIALSGGGIPFAAEHPSSLPERDEGAALRPEAAPSNMTAAAILYTSGTTGKPKGCVLSNLHAQEAGRYYAGLTDELALRAGTDRIMNPLPLYHTNSMIITLGGVIESGACLVLPGRFSASNWWNDIKQTGTTRFHYLGIMVPALLAVPESAAESGHRVRVAFGAGVEPAAHQRFEARFGIPLMEIWGMTETGRGLCVTGEPRYIDTRACGRVRTGLEAKILREDGTDAEDGEPGELVVRHCAERPRHGFFSGYLKDEAATEAAWNGGWFHSGDICRRAADGMFFFVDRQKNIIRRSGENISASEVEAVLAESKLVAQVAVMAVPDSLRDEEVLACVVLRDADAGDEGAADSLVAHAASRLAYYKVPGWFYFVEVLPTTGTQKVQKHRVFPLGFSADLPRLVDRRDAKKYQKRTEERY